MTGNTGALDASQVIAIPLLSPPNPIVVNNLSPVIATSMLLPFDSYYFSGFTIGATYLFTVHVSASSSTAIGSFRIGQRYTTNANPAITDVLLTNQMVTLSGGTSAGGINLGVNLICYFTGLTANDKIWFSSTFITLTQGLTVGGVTTAPVAIICQRIN
jgi:hypothetical protein